MVAEAAFGMLKGDGVCCIENVTPERNCQNLLSFVLYCTISVCKEEIQSQDLGAYL